MPASISGIPIVVLAIGALVIFFVTGKVLFKFITFGLVAAAVLYYGYITFFVGK